MGADRQDRQHRHEPMKRSLGSRMSETENLVAYPSIMRPVVGRRMVIASQPLAARAGLRMMENGGNAVDAAVAAAAAIAVVEPTNNGVGGDAFATVWDGSTLHGLNGSGRASRHSDREAFARRHRGSVPQRGWDSVTVPGAVSAWVELWACLGSLPFESLLQPAIEYAREGFHVPFGVAEKWADQSATLRDQPGFAQTFLPDGDAPSVGMLFRQPNLARTLERIAKTKGHDFYQGETAAAIAGFARQHGADLDEIDLAQHRADWCDLLTTRFCGADVFEMPPNGQGIVALYALAILEHWPLARYPVDSISSLHLQIEAIKLAFSEVLPWLGDTRQMTNEPARLLDPMRIAAAAARIDPARAQDFDQQMPSLAGTVYLASGDEKGQMVSYIQSNYMGFGSGVVVPDTGVALQNRGAGFSLAAESPARLEPGARPFHTILPGFVRCDGGRMAALGATGGSFQPQGHVQLLVRMLVYGQDPQMIVAAPRFKVEEGLRVAMEPGFMTGTVQGLTDLGHDITALESSTWDFGGMQILQRQDGYYVGGCDARRDSHIAVS